MKKEITKLLALLILGATVLTSCSIENRRGRHDNDRHRNERHHDGDHHYRGY